MSTSQSTDKLPPRWEMRLPGYAVYVGLTKRERTAGYYALWCDARGGKVRAHSDDGQGVPHEVVRACIAAADDFPAEFKV